MAAGAGVGKRFLAEKLAEYDHLQGSSIIHNDMFLIH